MIYMSFFIGLILICKGGDWFVDAASKISETLGIPKYVVGATIVSFATTMPEIIVSAAAALKGHSAMAIGNAVVLFRQIPELFLQSVCFFFRQQSKDRIIL